MNNIKHDLLVHCSVTTVAWQSSEFSSGPAVRLACQNHSNVIRTLVLQAMAEWYMRGEGLLLDVTIDEIGKQMCVECMCLSLTVCLKVY